MQSTEDYYKAWYNDLKKKAEAGVSRALKTTWNEWIIYVESDLRAIFKSAIDDFYADYTPNIYKRKHSMYNLLHTEMVDEGNGMKSLEAEFLPEKMSKYRNHAFASESGLYDQVFRKGWHGGAPSGDYTFIHTKNGDEDVLYTPHPDPGVPYWRAPVPYYIRWDRTAAIAPVAPLVKIQEEIGSRQSEYWNARYKEIFNREISKIRL